MPEHNLVRLSQVEVVAYDAAQSHSLVGSVGEL